MDAESCFYDFSSIKIFIFSPLPLSGITLIMPNINLFLQYRNKSYLFIAIIVGFFFYFNVIIMVLAFIQAIFNKMTKSYHFFKDFNNLSSIMTHLSYWSFIFLNNKDSRRFLLSNS